MAAPKHRSRFLSTPSARRATLGGVCFFLCAVISIHALCEEGDSTPARRRSWLIYFYPRPLRGGRPSPSRLTPSSCYFYPRPLRGGRPDAGPARLIDLLGISIHALCEEGDIQRQYVHQEFRDFYPRPLRGGRHLAELQNIMMRAISIHALCEEGDWQRRHERGHQAVFLSTPSARRATSSQASEQSNGQNFYPRPLRGGRPAFRDSSTITKNISIHALCEEGDPPQFPLLLLFYDFYPRPLRGGRPVEWAKNLGIYKISIHALCEEGDASCKLFIVFLDLFLSTPSARRATGAAACLSGHGKGNFYPRPLRGGRQSPSPALCTPSLFLSTPSARRATHQYLSGFGRLHRFLSTPSARRATLSALGVQLLYSISIHALCEEGDQSRPIHLSGCPYFYPRPLRGGRPHQHQAGQ